MDKGPIAPDIDLAAYLFDRLEVETADKPGVTRAAYGPGEAIAHRLCRKAAADLDLETTTDGAGNLYMTLPGRERSAPQVVIGSHLDSVPHGGNYDGAAGVIAGLAAVSGLSRSGLVPRRDVTVMAIRAEEGVWFPHSYIGSRMALGQLEPALLQSLRRSDTGRTLADHIAEAGFDPAAVRAGRGGHKSDRVAAFIEPHIEQGPLLLAAGAPLGVVTGIRGNFRYRSARCIGESGHSGTVPRQLRHDAVAATAELVCRFEEIWERCEAEGRDFAVTFGRFSTDPAVHGFSRIPGEVAFAVDMRSSDPALLTEMHARLNSQLRSIEARRGVRFEMQDYSQAGGAQMDHELQRRLRRTSEHRSVPCKNMTSGAGHDAVAFAEAGVATAMLFIRNENGSHNPDEAMAMEDFAAAAGVLADAVVDYPAEYN